MTAEEAEVVLEGVAGQEDHDRLHKSGAREVFVKDEEQLCAISATDQFI